MIPTDVCCYTCAFWRQDLPRITTGTRRPEGSDPELGTCTFTAPVVLAIGGLPVSYQPETHRTRSCENWLWDDPDGPFGPDGPDGGEPAEVINLSDRRAAA